MRISDLIAYTAFRWRLWRASRRMKKAVIGYAETRGRSPLCATVTAARSPRSRH